MTGPRTVRAPRGTQLACKSWLTEAAYRMLQNNLDPEVRNGRRIWWSTEAVVRPALVGGLRRYPRFSNKLEDRDPSGAIW
jgi:hypothetical protein